MSETNAREYYRQWFEMRASVKHGKAHSTVRKRAEHLESTIDKLDISTDVCRQIFNEEERKTQMGKSAKSKAEHSRVVAAVVELAGRKGRANSTTKRVNKASKDMEAAAAGITKAKKPMADKWPWPTTATVACAAAEASVEIFTSATPKEPIISTEDKRTTEASTSSQVIYMVAIGTMYDPENDGRYTESIGVSLMFANYPDNAAILNACMEDPTFSRHPGFKSAMRNVRQGLRIWGIPQLPDADKQRPGYAIHAASADWLAHVNMHESSELSHCLGNLTIYRKIVN